MAIPEKCLSSRKQQKWSEPHRRFVEELFESGEAERLSHYIRRRLPGWGDDCTAWEILELAFDKLRMCQPELFVVRRCGVSLMYRLIRQAAAKRIVSVKRRPQFIAIQEHHGICDHPPYARLQQEELSQTARHEIDLLPHLQRRVMHGTLDGYSDDEIAQRLYGEELSQAEESGSETEIARIKGRVRVARSKARQELRERPSMRPYQEQLFDASSG